MSFDHQLQLLLVVMTLTDNSVIMME